MQNVRSASSSQRCFRTEKIYEVLAFLALVEGDDTFHKKRKMRNNSAKVDWNKRLPEYRDELLSAEQRVQELYINYDTIRQLTTKVRDTESGLKSWRMICNHSKKG